MVRNTDFVICDVETTGLFPNGSDRIIEVAFLRMSPYGEIFDEYSTLINPHRDVGPTHIHGISARDVINAPVFSEVAGDILERMAGAVFVAHNVGFDQRFILAEMSRLGCKLPDFPCLCTMQLAQIADPNIPGRKLEVLCKYFGIQLDSAHSAYHDARATASLMEVCINRLGDLSHLSLSDLGLKRKPSPKESWPLLEKSGLSCQREDVIHREPSYIAALVSKLPFNSKSRPEMDSYFALLDRVLEDRKITQDEFLKLQTLAEDLGISQYQAVSFHKEYMHSLIKVALLDNVITNAEKEDLEKVRNLLDISNKDFEEMLSMEMQERTPESEIQIIIDKKKDELTGKTVLVQREMDNRRFI